MKVVQVRITMTEWRWKEVDKFGNLIWKQKIGLAGGWDALVQEGDTKEWFQGFISTDKQVYDVIYWDTQEWREKRTGFWKLIWDAY